MKNILIIVVCIMLTGSSLYAVKGYIVEVNDDLVTVVDICGEIWEFYGDGYDCGMIVTLVFDTRETAEYIYDDEIIDVR